MLPQVDATMPCIRLSPSASVTRTDAGVILCSDLGTFQITGPDLGRVEARHRAGALVMRTNDAASGEVILTIEATAPFSSSGTVQGLELRTG
jgi:hypothetical protein